MRRAKDQAITILLVEDESIIRMASAAMLEDVGYTIIEATDADDALRTLHHHPEVNVVVTDVQMPGTIDGLALVEILTHDYPHIETVITSGRTSVNAARQSGAIEFLAKPYTAAAIQTAVKTALRGV
jgi:DNA-binding NtrC family response regulator